MKNIIKIILILVVFLAIPYNSKADYNTTNSNLNYLSYLYLTSSLSQKSYLDYTWMQNGDLEKNNLASITVGYGTGHVNLYDANNNIVSVNFNEFNGGLGISTSSLWAFAVGATEHNDIEDNAQLISSYLQVSKKTKLSGMTNSENGFTPSLKYKLKMNFGQYTHKPVGQSNSIAFDQNSTKFTLTYNANYKYDLSIAYKKYFYPTNPAEFITRTNSLNLGNTTSLFTGAISLLPDNTISLIFDVQIKPKFNLELSVSQTKDAADPGTGTDLSATLLYEAAEKWNWNLGISQSKYTTNIAASTYALLGIDYFY